MAEQSTRKYVMHAVVVTVGLVEIDVTPNETGGTIDTRVMQHQNRYYNFLLPMNDEAERNAPSEAQKSDLARETAAALIELALKKYNGQAPDEKPSAPVPGFPMTGLFGGNDNGSAQG